MNSYFHTRAALTKAAKKAAIAALSLLPMMGAVQAACSLTNFNTRLESTGTAPFNSGDVCTAGGVSHVAGNDACKDDNVVRTNDTFIYRFNFKVPTLQIENNITFKASLPLVAGKKVAVWDGIPPQCTGSGTSVSADGLDLVCNIGDVNRTGASSGDYTSALLAQVKSTIAGANGDQLVNVQGSVTSDSCSAGAVPATTFPVVEISARQKVDVKKDYPYGGGQTAYEYNGVKGYLVGWYIYADQYDPAGAGARGGQSITSPLVLKDIPTNFPAGAVWFDCAKESYQGSISCPTRGTPVTNGLAQDVTISAQASEATEFLIAGGLNTASQQDPSASNAARLATFYIRYFVPLSAINAAPGGQINLRNDIPADQIVGTDRSGATFADTQTTNNGLPITVVGSLPGGYYKYVASEWGYPWAGPTPGAPGVNYTQMQGTNNYGNSGTGLTYGGQYFYPRLDYNNPSVLNATNIVMCEAIDSTKVRIAEISTMPGHGAADIFATPSDRGQPSTRFPQGYSTQYGVAATQGGPGAAGSRCDDSDATWYDTLTAAAAAGARENINRVRMKVPEVGFGDSMYFMIAQQTRPGVNGTIIDDYYSLKASNINGSSGTPGDWVLSSYDKVTNNGVGLGKRFKLTTALARIAKDASLNVGGPSINSATAGGTVVYKLTPSLNSSVATPQPTYVTISDKLPKQVAYVAGSTTIGGVAREPDSIVSDTTGTTLAWTLNNVVPNQVLPVIEFKVSVPQTIAPNSTILNTADIATPDDVSDITQRTATKSLTVLNPPGFYVNKLVAASKIDPNGTAKFKLQISNFESAPTVVDTIDVLPYVGDARLPLTAYAGSRGLLGAITVTNGGTARYTSKASASINFDPNDPTDPGFDTTKPANPPTTANGWCLEAEFGTGGCPANFAAVTGWRVTGSPIAANSTIEFDFDMPTQSNQLGNVYTNRFYTKSNNPSLASLRSNDVPVTVALASISGRVYVDSDQTATRGANEPGIGNVVIELCLVAPVNGACPTGSEVRNPLNNQILKALTQSDGTYRIDNVPSSPAGGYYIIESKPAGYGNGPTNAAGSLGGVNTPNLFGNVVVPTGAAGTNYNFGHLATDLYTTVTLPTAAVAPFSPVDGTVVFGNSSSIDGANTQATITMNPGLTGVVITLPAGWQFAPGSPAGGYDAATGKVNLVPVAAGGVFPANTSVTVGVRANAPEPGPLTITSLVTNSIADLTASANPIALTDPNTTDPNRNTHKASVGVLAMAIDTRKRVATPRPLTNSERTALGVGLTDNAYVVPYRVVTSNKGPIVSTNIQTTDRLDFTFPAPATIVGVFKANAGFTGAKGAALVAGSHPNCALSATPYDGKTQPNFYSGSFNLPALVDPANPDTASACTVEFTVVVNYGTNPTPQTALKNSAFASANNNPNNPGPSFDAAGVPTYGAPGHRVADASTDTPEVPAQAYPGGQYPIAPTPGTSAAGADIPDPTPVILGVPQQLDVRKSASQPVQLDVSGRRFRVAYTVNVTNTGTVNVTSVQLSENLRFTFPTPATFTATAPTLVSGSCPVNTAFDGGKTNTATGYNLVGTNGSSSYDLVPTAACVFSFAVDVDYGADVVPVAAPANRVFGSSALGANTGPLFDALGTKTADAPNMISKDSSTTVVATVPTYGTPPADPGAPATANSDVGSSTLAKIRTLEVVKSVVGSVQIVSYKKYRVPYVTKITAVGTVGEVLPNVQAIDNLLQTFRRSGAALPTLQVVNHQVPVAGAGATCPASFTSFNGDTDQKLFAGNTALTVGQSCEFKFDVIVDYGTADVDVGPHQNTVYASSVPVGTNNGGAVALTSTRTTTGTNGIVAGTWTPPVGAIAIDASTDGAAVPVTSGADKPLPTPVAFVLASPLSAIKYVENVRIPGAPVVSGSDIKWTIVYKNEGTLPLTGVQIADTLAVSTINPKIVKIEKSALTVGGPVLALTPNANYNGASAQDLLSVPTTLDGGQFITITLTAKIKDDYVGTLNNQASLTANEYGGLTGQKVLTSAVNPNAPACLNANACIPVGVSVPTTALVSQPAGNATKDQPNVLTVVQGGSISGLAWFDADSNGAIGANETRVPGLRVGVFAIDPISGVRLAEVTDPANRPITDANGAYKVGGLPPSTAGGPLYEVIFYNEAGVSSLGKPAPMATGNANNGSLPSIPNKDRITKIKVTSGVDTPAQNLPLDPSGVVYDALTRKPVPGALVTLVGPVGFDPAIHLQGGTPNVAQTTGATGLYQFVLLGNAPAGVYSLVVKPPVPYSAPSELITPTAGPLEPPSGAGNTFPVQPQETAPSLANNESTKYYLSFKLTPGVSRDVVHNHIPLDPSVPTKLTLAKSVNRPQSDIGDVVTYTLRVRNVGNGAALRVVIEDRLPAGFRYIPGTTQVAVNAGAALAPTADPVGGVGPKLDFRVPSVLAVNNEAIVTYKVRIGVGSQQGDGINKAIARNGNVSSNEARAKVKVDSGVFTTQACVIGKVFVDCNNNHIQDAEELGIPGVRLLLQDGTSMITDSEGKYSYCGLQPKSNVLKVDGLTLPRGARLTTSSNRNLGDANSLFLDVKNGELVRADFIEGSCSNTVLEQVKSRRTDGEVRAPGTEKKGQPAKKFEGKSSSYPQQGTDSANQPLVTPRAKTSGGESNQENDTPVPNLPAASNNTRGLNIRDGK